MLKINFLLAVVFFVASIQVFITKDFSMKYGQVLKLDNLSYLVSFVFLMIALMLILPLINNKNKDDKYKK